jgi:hypothetical protein
VTPRDLPFPTSLCHQCSAPPRYLQGKSTTFILCPRLPKRYPPQPVTKCEYFTPVTAKN